jgi:hypothetical protein
MALKKFNQALEHAISREVKLLDNIYVISRTLFSEAVAFRERNGLVVVASSVKGKKPIFQCCPQCLKAHLLKKAEEMDLSKAVREVIREMAEVETGHYGYYVDDGMLVRI